MIQLDSIVKDANQDFLEMLWHHEIEEIRKIVTLVSVTHLELIWQRMAMGFQSVTVSQANVLARIMLLVTTVINAGMAFGILTVVLVARLANVILLGHLMQLVMSTRDNVFVGKASLVADAIN